MIIEKTFTSEKEIVTWISNPDNIDALKAKYPEKEYKADINLTLKQLEINERI